MRRRFGRTGVEVNAIGFGAWQLSNLRRPSEADAIEVIRRAVDAGVDLIDTADAYSLDDDEFGHNELLIRRALGPLDRSPVTVATKVGFRRPNGAWTTDGRPVHIKAGCDESLRRLDVESIFLYQLHRPDPTVPLAETVGALADLHRAGKIRHVGLSNVNRTQLDLAQSIVRIEGVQNECNPVVRDDVDSGLVEYCGDNDVAYLPYRPVGGPDGHESLASNPVIAGIARRHDVSPHRIALAWLLDLGEHVVPIPGATRAESILDSLAATDVRLSEAERERIEALPAGA